MSLQQLRLSVWVRLLALRPLAIAGLATSSALSIDSGCNVRTKAKPVAARGSATDSAPMPVALPELTGAPVDLSTVMGRARKLANAWQSEAALLGIEATLAGGKVQTQAGAAAKITFGPSPFAPPGAPSGLFVVTYDKSGINGAPVKGTPGKALPEPMCAPEGVLLHVTDLAPAPLTLRYGFDASQRPMWLVTTQEQPTQPRLFDPHDCKAHGIVAPHTR